MVFPIQQGRTTHWLSSFRSVLLGSMLISVLLAGCGNKHVPPPQIVFIIESEKEANEGQPFHCAVRSVNAKQFVTEASAASLPAGWRWLEMVSAVVKPLWQLAHHSDMPEP